ncbi:kynureninase [Sphingomonas vulcanisoli]|uniref:Kynureninase n=1 Tax=Sphingomonas vulcanisoli TaxID=1658060 RepID=A0ABX0TSS7_9SPHN|nr:kynureninase [Sphingomonas vulcanisoli]NIJ06850.1 kynureninase [Sphingomonas vulcanisoli]
MPTLPDAEALDRADPFAEFRDRFALPEGVIYLDGNSLGALPRSVAARLEAVARHEWGERLIRSWNEADWWNAPRRIGDRIARLLGVSDGEVIATDSTSVNLFKLIMAAAGTRDGAIIAEADNFPTDTYVAEEAARLLGRPFRLVAGSGMVDALVADVAAAVITQVNYRTAARADIAALEERARRHGTRIVWDLSHSIGAVPLDLARDGASLAVGCSYKYLNGGPGAPAWLYVASALQAKLRSPIAGWWGHADAFAFDGQYRPAPDIARFLGGTQPMLSLLALEESLTLFERVDMDRLWAKSVRLFDLFAARIEALCPELTILTPRDPALRGSHIALHHPDAQRIITALIERGVIGDYRAPDIARFGLTPLTLSHADILYATGIIGDVMASGAWRDVAIEGGRVT